MSMWKNMLHVLAEQGPFEDESGFATRRWYEALGQGSMGSFSTQVFSLKKRELIETLTNGKKTYLIEITPRGREEIAHYVPLPIVSEPETELEVEPEIIPEPAPEPKPEVVASTNLSEFFELAAQKARELQEVVADYASMKRRLEELSQEVARLKTANLRKSETIDSLEAELEVLRKQGRKTLRADQLPRWCRDLGKLALQQGWSVIDTPSGHYKWTSPKGDSFNESATPSDHRAHANLKARLQRMGMSLL